MTTLQEILTNHDNRYGIHTPWKGSEPVSTSIIIPVYEEPETLRHTLKWLTAQQEMQRVPENFELLIVDDGSSSPISDLVKEFHLKCDVHYIRHSKNKGASAARNTGIKNASKDLLVFLDSDVLLPREGYFAKHWDIHSTLAECSRAAIVVGLAENISLLEAGKFYKDKSMPDIKKDFRFYDDGTDWYPAREPASILKDSDLFQDFKELGTYTLPEMVVTHNVSILRSVAADIGGFNEDFAFCGIEDTEFGARVMAAGHYVIPLLASAVYRIVHEPRGGVNKEEVYKHNLKIYSKILQKNLLGDFNS